MHTEIVSVDICGNGHRFETLNEKFVNLLVIILPEDLLSEREMLSHSPALVIASQHNDFVWVADFEGVQEYAHIY